MPAAAFPKPSHEEIFRVSVPIRLGAYYVLLGGCALFSWLGLGIVSPWPIVAITAFETATLALCYRRASASRRVAALYLLVEAVCQTAIFYASGSLRIGFAAIVYTAELLNPGLALDRRAHFVVANGFVVLFASLVVAEHTGSLPAYPSPGLAVSPQLGLASIAIVFLCLNVAAFFVSSVREQLEARSIALWYAQQTLKAHGEALEQRVQERTSELEQSYRMLQDTTQELQTFVYTVTHDLKNPFNAILLTATLILRQQGEALTDEMRYDLEHMARAAGHGENMLRDLMRMFQVASAREPHAAVDTNSLVAQAVEALAAKTADRGVCITVDPLPDVSGQREKLRHVIGNLLDNAVKHVRRGDGLILVTGRREGDRVVLEVRDNGTGIPAAYQRRIFELFSRVPGADGGEGDAGTGVGLALVKRIVEDHGGEVWVESVPGRGSAFFVRLQASESLRDPAPPGEPHPPAARRASA